MAQVPYIGIAWYSRISYRKLRSIFDDGELLPASFEEWQEIAETGTTKLAAAGYRPVRVYIEPVSFSKWCREHHFRPDS
jgi:hypothetical protein